MKKIYATILLFSYLTGVLQPMLPMITYYQQADDTIVQIFKVSYTSQATHTDGGATENNTRLLNLQFYPLALHIEKTPLVMGYFSVQRVFIFTVHSVNNRADKPQSPPPRLT